MGKFLDSVDVKALRFAIGFPVLLAAAFALSAVLLRPDLPDPLAVQWNDGGGISFAPFEAYVGVGAAMIIAAGWLVLWQAVPVSRPTVMRRIMMGAGLTLSLFVTTVLAAGLVGQAGEADARESHVDFIVLSTGSGAALALGVIMGFVFKADRQWTPEDDRALQRALELELDPELATDSIRLWVHARSSVFVMIGIASLFPASLIAIAVPWLGALLVAAAILGAAFLFARVTADRSGLRVFVAGILRVVDVPAEAISAAAPADIRAADYGGWGYRNHGGTAAVLVSSGPAVVVRKTDGRRLAVSGGNTDSAVRLAEVLTRIAARARRDGRSPSEGEGDA
jgi:MFS family permease